MNSLGGLLLVNKSSGMTSHDVVARARRILKRKDIGHAGTLDPMASGLMVLLVGEATKLSDYILNGDKAYRADIKFGITTDSLDITGEILSESPVTFSEADLSAAVLALTGEVELDVPKYSAVKVEGRRLYDYALKDQEVVCPKRIMKFYDLACIGFGGITASFEIHCSKGSYIRAWVHALGQALGCGAALSGLERTISTPYLVGHSLSLEEIEARLIAGASLGACWVDLNECLPSSREVKLAGRDIQMIRNGQISNDVQAKLLIGIKISESLPLVKLINQETRDLLAILTAKPGEFYKIKRVFQQPSALV